MNYRGKNVYFYDTYLNVIGVGKALETDIRDTIHVKFKKIYVLETNKWEESKVARYYYFDKRLVALSLENLLDKVMDYKLDELYDIIRLGKDKKEKYVQILKDFINKVQELDVQEQE